MIKFFYLKSRNTINLIWKVKKCHFKVIVAPPYDDLFLGKNKFLGVNTFQILMFLELIL